MELKEALLKRRSIRKFTDEPVSREEIDELLYAAMCAPSACNRRPWEFFAVTNPELLGKLKNASFFSRHDAPLAIVVCGNLNRALPLDMAEYWIQDCSAATENILLRAADLGLGAVWCGIYPQPRPEKKVRELLSLSDKQIPLSLILIGHPAEEGTDRKVYDESCIHRIN